MSLLRHNVVLLAQTAVAPAPVTGPVFRIRPNDGDAVPDGQQRWWVAVDLLREGPGVVAATVSTSFDGIVWYPVAAVNTRRSERVVELLELEAFAPLVRVDVAGTDSPQFTATVRLASDGPFAAVPG